MDIWTIIISTVISSSILTLLAHTFIKSSIQESIKNVFETERLKRREEFDRELHHKDRTDKFQLAAVDQRLKSNQQAYEMAVKFIWTVHDKGDKNIQVHSEFTDFWNKNCLYLTKETREALWASSRKHLNYDNLWHVWRDAQTPEASKELQEAFDIISNAPELIMNSVDKDVFKGDLTRLEDKEITAYEIKSTKK